MLLFLLAVLVCLWSQHPFEQGFTSKPFSLQMIKTWSSSHPSAKHPRREMTISLSPIPVTLWSRTLPHHSQRTAVRLRKDTAGWEHLRTLR